MLLSIPKLCRGIFCKTKLEKNTLALTQYNANLCISLRHWGKVIKQRTLCLHNAFWVISSQDKKTICQEESFHVPLSVLTFFFYSIVLLDIFLKSFPVQPGELKDKLFIIKEEDGGLSDERITSLRRYDFVPKKHWFVFLPNNVPTKAERRMTFCLWAVDVCFHFHT